MLFVYIFSAAIAVGTVSHIIHLSLRDRMIDTHGREIRALVEDVRRVAEYDDGSITIAYRLSWHEDRETKCVEGRETILARRSAQVQEGCEIDIKYLDDDHISFVFEKGPAGQPSVLGSHSSVLSPPAERRPPPSRSA
ncbi:hypothetical protein ACFC5Z_13415 [Streptomyces sp. NPDC056004]|uniref:hypothetical protein n=1 Tax=unclassified Streptomyces TaxID=2593676 RepID=UPI0035D6A01E